MKNYFSFQWHILDDCDQRCKHCYIFNADDNENLNTMDFTDILNVLDSAVEMCRKTDRILYFSITGGDPILHPHFWDLLEVLHDKNLDYSIMGNPFHLNVMSAAVWLI